jgi:3-ketosteroid 9alpha-monooxygenase subunit B
MTSVKAPGSTALAKAANAHGFHRLRVKAVVDETADTRTYLLEVPPELQALFRYEPGQFCTFRVQVGETEQLRSYSMSSAPETDPDLAVTVKRVPEGLVSNWFYDTVRVGDVLETTKPAGVFCLRDGERPVVAFAGGSGITPVMSIAKRALTSTTRPVALLYANRDGDSVIFAGQLAELQHRYGEQLTVRYHDDTDAGLLDAAGVTDFARPHLGTADFYLCGPTPFMDLVEEVLLDQGVSADSILLERFGTPTSPLAIPADGSFEERPDTVTLVVKGQARRVPYVAGDTVLKAARRAAVPTPYSCEAGNCATCMATLREGTASMHVNNALTAAEVDEGWILTCQSVLSGPTATIEFEDL